VLFNYLEKLVAAAAGRFSTNRSGKFDKIFGFTKLSPVEPLILILINRLIHIIPREKYSQSGFVIVIFRHLFFGFLWLYMAEL